jgi:uracil-DNA glycosylase
MSQRGGSKSRAFATPAKSSASVHFNNGRLGVAFVFSAPGAREIAAGKPVAGVSGENLDFALEYLHAKCSRLFASPQRYAYRITNASSLPLARSRGDLASEAKPAHIVERANIARIKRELRGCDLVILCGRRAELLSPLIVTPGRAIISMSHIGNRALATKYSGSRHSAGASPLARRKSRARAWARELLRSLQATHVA